MTDLRRKLALLLASYKEAGYTPLEWIQGDGRTQYIQFAGVFPKADDAIEVVAEAKEFGSGGYAYVYGAGNATNNANAVNCVILPSGGNGGRFLGRTYSGFTGALDTQYVIYEDAVMQTFNGTKQTDTGTASGQCDTNPLTLFRHGATKDAQLANTCGVLRISSLRMWNRTTGKLILDVVPVLDKDGVACFWDRVKNKLYYNKGTDSFTYKEWNCSLCDYVYADGDAYINTYQYGDNNTAIEGYFMSTNARSQVVGGARSSATSNSISIFHPGNANTNTIVMDFGDYRETRFNNSMYPINSWYIAHNEKTQRWAIDKTSGEKYVYAKDYSGTVATPTPLYVGYKSSNFAASNNPFIGNYKYWKQWDGKVITRNLMPAVYEDNRVGFYDECLNIMFYSFGTSDFVGHYVDGQGNDYEVVKSIIADGNQFINCNMKVNQDTKTRIYFNNPTDYSETNTNMCIFGARDKSSGDGSNMYVLFTNANKKFRFDYGAQQKAGSSILTTGKHTYLKDGRYSYVDGSLAVTNTEYNFTSSRDAYLFCLNSIGTATYKFVGTIYNATVWDKKKKVRNFIPVINSSNVAGMYDTVSKAFFGNAGTGNFTYE